ncbi:hypothetical protein [Microvirga lotononidis]|uniref:hypothetical protein n=1 Tax=Microvirga lotononidis TaxID=864069 RepID=UPI000316F307|nr:hypothetical protein [Microvirga lotononidis]WQO31790.1 hypothetical protein U0023_31035 [Microvirga lotononidis]
MSVSDCSVLIFFRQRLDIANAPSTMASASLQGLDLPEKLCRECCFTPESLITRVTAQTRVHVPHPRFEGAPENA